MAITINVNLDEILAALKNDLDFTGNADKYIKVNATADGFEFAAVSAGATWGSITGTLSDQTDLQSALDAKLTANSPITGATKTKVTYDANGLITSGADATTADIADSLDKRYITDAQQTILGNTSGTNTGDETTSTIKTKLGAASSLQDGYLTSTDWTTFNSKQAALGFTPEDVANKSTSTSLGTSDTLYPSQNAVKSYVDTGLATKYDASNPSGYITGIAWGAITGTLSSQTDLQSALDAKAALAGAAFTGAVSVTTSGSGDTLQLTNSGSGTTLNILNSGSGDFLTIDSTKLVLSNNGNLAVDTDTLYVDAANNRVGIGTAAPITNLDIRSAVTPTFRVVSLSTGSNGRAAFTIGRLSSGSETGWQFLKDTDDSFVFRRITSGSTASIATLQTDGTLGINNSSPSAMLDIVSNATSKVGLEITAAAGQTANLLEIRDSSGSALTFFANNGAWSPSSLADANAANGTVYYSTDAGKLVYKDSTGTSNNLYDDGLIDINTQTASYTLVLADANKLVRMNVASANNLTIPPNSSVAFGVGTILYVEQMGAGTTTVVAGSGVTINTTALKTPYQYGTITLIQVSADVWNVLGGTV